MITIVTGTPCTGKTTFAKKLKGKYINVNSIIDEYKLSSHFDKKRNCKVVDVKKLVKILMSLIKKSQGDLIIDSHLSHYIPAKYVDKCYVCKCSLKTLKKRLEKRKYLKEKIKENLDAEIFDVCYTEALEMGHKIKIIKN